MVLLRVKVTCQRCKKRVEKLQTRALASALGETTYECFECFKRERTPRWGTDEGIKMRRDMFCQRCRYKFSSVTAICPYCNQSDALEAGNLTADDLL